MPAESEEDVLVLRELDPRSLIFRSRRQEVRLGDDSKGAISSIEVSSFLEDDLIGVIILGGYDSENDGPLLLDIIFNQCFDCLNVVFGLLFVLRVDESREIHKGKLRTIWSRDLDAKNITIEGTQGALSLTKTHEVRNFIHEVREFIKVGNRLLVGLELLLLIYRANLVGIDLDSYRLILGATKDDLGSEPSAEVFFARERNAGDCFQYRALARRLVSAGDNLGKLNDGSKAGTTELIDNIHNGTHVLALESLERGGAQALFLRHVGYC